MSLGLIYEEIYRRLLSLTIAFYTLLQKQRFGNFGKGSRIYPHVSLNLPSGIHIGEGVVIREHVWLNTKGRREDGEPVLVIGDRAYIGRCVQINAWHKVIIEPEALISDRVYISDADHRFEDTKVPVMMQGDYFKGSVILGAGCWIGVGAVILPGVRVGRNAVVGANAVVTRNVPDCTIAVGVPARVIREIGKNPN